MLFIPKPNKDIFDQYPELEAFPEFKALTDKQMKTLIWFADYRSPFRQKPQDERMKLACLKAGYITMKDKNQTLEFRAREIMGGKLEAWTDALKVYMGMQHDEDREMVELVDSQVENIRSVLATKTDDEALLEKRNKLINSLPDLRETKRKLARMANMEELVMGIADSNEEEGNKRSLSLVDRMAEENNNTNL